MWKFAPLLILLCFALPLLPTANAATPSASPSSKPAPSYVKHAQAQAASGDLQGALKTLNDYLATAPQDANARFEKGIVLTRLGKTKKALDVFTSLTQDYPQLPEPYNNLAVIYAKQGKYGKARDALKAALATHPSYATAAENLGDVYAAMAAQAYHQALKIDKNNKQIRYKLALIQRLDQSTGNTAPAPTTPTPSPGRQQTPTAAAEQRAAAPASKASTRPQPAATADAEKAVASAVQAWAKAWSDQDVTAYINHYASNFTGDSKTHAAWKQDRNEHLNRPAYIHLTVSHLKVSVRGANQATARFEQHYKSNTYHDTVHKVLRFKRTGGQWKIVSEVSH